VGAASSRDHLISRLEAAPTTNTICSLQITGIKNFVSPLMIEVNWLLYNLHVDVIDSSIAGPLASLCHVGYATLRFNL
jgi:hypothetical protein